MCVYIYMHAHIWGSSRTYIYTHTLQAEQLGKVLLSSFTQRVSNPDPLLLKAEQTTNHMKQQRKEADFDGSVKIES